MRRQVVPIPGLDIDIEDMADKAKEMGAQAAGSLLSSLFGPGKKELGPASDDDKDGAPPA